MQPHYLETLTELVEQRKIIRGRRTEEGRGIDATIPAEHIKILRLGMPHEFVSNNLHPVILVVIIKIT
jgi:hypothetical protein